MRSESIPSIALAGAAALAQNPKAAPMRLSLPANVEAVRDIVYAAYGARQLRLDLYLPKPRPAKLAGVIAIRGGGWKMGDKNGFAKISAHLAAHGFAVACIEYRVIPEVKPPDPVHDSKAAVRWMRAEGGAYGIRPDTIGAIGGSAGGQMAALLATSYKVAALEGSGGHAGVSSRVQAVVAMAPVADFLSIDSQSKRGDQVVQSVFGGNRDLAKQLSPVTHLDRDSAPILLIHSKADSTVPYAQSEEMLEHCRKTGVSAELVTIEGAPHAFWNGEKWFGDVIDKSAEFFHAMLDAGRH